MPLLVLISRGGSMFYINYKAIQRNEHWGQAKGPTENILKTLENIRSSFVYEVDLVAAIGGAGSLWFENDKGVHYIMDERR